jgi:hypothetical protein
MAQIVEADIAKAIFLDKAAKPKVRAFVMKRRTIRMAEYEMVFVLLTVLAALPSIPNFVPLLHTEGVVVA